MSKPDSSGRAYRFNGQTKNQYSLLIEGSDAVQHFRVAPARAKGEVGGPGPAQACPMGMRRQVTGLQNGHALAESKPSRLPKDIGESMGRVENVGLYVWA